ncbi:hypothetical protein P9057_09725 [Gallibacterium anatis]|uniref:hypothetical protein n=1 Tax=Gallibacterium anatis TaxID=750 RepID=UPI0018B0015C
MTTPAPTNAATSNPIGESKKLMAETIGANRKRNGANANLNKFFTEFIQNESFFTFPPNNLKFNIMAIM